MYGHVIDNHIALASSLRILCKHWKCSDSELGKSHFELGSNQVLSDRTGLRHLSCRFKNGRNTTMGRKRLRYIEGELYQVEVFFDYLEE